MHHGTLQVGVALISCLMELRAMTGHHKKDASSSMQLTGDKWFYFSEMRRDKNWKWQFFVRIWQTERHVTRTFVTHMAHSALNSETSFDFSMYIHPWHNVTTCTSEVTFFLIKKLKFWEDTVDTMSWSIQTFLNWNCGPMFFYDAWHLLRVILFSEFLPFCGHWVHLFHDSLHGERDLLKREKRLKGGTDSEASNACM